MATKPILFSGPMVRAILAGHKTQTRRVVPFPIEERKGHLSADGALFLPPESFPLAFAAYKPGDIIWVRETWKEWHSGMCGCGGDVCHCPPDGSPLFRADIPHKMSAEEYGPWRPSIFMPKRHCRIFLVVNSVRVERLTDITHNDALGEGIVEQAGGFAVERPNGGWHRTHCPRLSFFALWEDINGKRPGCGLNQNPWVWVYEFERTEKPAGWPGN